MSESAGTLPLMLRRLLLAAVAAVLMAPVVVHAEPDQGLVRAGEHEMSVEQRTVGRMRMAAPRAAVDQQRLMATAPPSIAGSDGSWTPFGHDPLLNNVKDYTPISATPTMAGRVQDFAAVPATPGRVFAAFGNSGIFETRDSGATWKSIGDTLPTPFSGAVAFTPAGGGTIIDGTGDSGYGFLGLGVYRSTDDGHTWQHAAGVPDGALTFRLTVDPTNSQVVYAATSKGLFRSSDAALSFVNVALPTGKTQAAGPDCAGNTTDYHCVYDNWVTDVAVRSAGGADPGGEVLAAVGWFRGDHVTAQGWNNAVSNGVYRSPNGLPGSFVDLDVSSHGFTSPKSHIGNISLSTAAGPQQNHAVVWAIVQDAQAANDNLPLVDPVPGDPGVCAVASCYNTLLDSLYVSSDFGSTWTKKLLDPHALQACAVTSTDQCGLLPLPPPVSANYGPGIQAWYNLHIRVDPTMQDGAGAPTRVVFGLEELWAVDNANGAGPVTPHVIGRYYGDACSGTTLIGPCPGAPPAPTTTHPDQHAALFIPDGQGGVTLYAGNDGGVFTQHVAAGGNFDNAHWGAGANEGLHTLLPYQAVMAKDGTAYAGLQDNGEMKVTPDGRQVEVFGGDGGFSAVDPDNSKVVYEEYVGGQISASTDGGHNWTSINPGNTGPQFIVAFSMDPTDAKHLITGGQDIEETTAGPATTAAGIPAAATDWVKVFDLGTGTGRQSHALSASDVRGDAAYVGFCGACYIPSTAAYGFENGIATNVGGDKPGKRMTGDGWHFAKHEGLPEREIKSMKMDSADPKTIYVTLGDYDASYRPPGVLGDDTSKSGHTHVWKSTDAGDHFTDISGNLPEAPAWSVVQHGAQLLVGTSVGAFISNDLNGSRWAALGGTSLPPALVRSLQVSPGDSSVVLAATYGRGLWLYHFPSVVPAPAPGGAQGRRAGEIPVTGGGGPAAGLAVLAVAVVVIAARRRLQRR
jgi:hypothetical protein